MGTMSRGLREREGTPTWTPARARARALSPEPGARGAGVGASGGRDAAQAAPGADGASPSSSVLRFPRVCSRAAGDSFVVSAFASGRKGMEEAEPSMGSKQVGLWAREAVVRVVTPGGVGEMACQPG